MNIIKKCIIVSSVFLIGFVCSNSFVFANSAQTHWTGTDSTYPKSKHTGYGDNVKELYYYTYDATQINHLTFKIH